MLAFVVPLAVICVAVVAWVTIGRTSTEDRYLQALEEADLDSMFRTDEAAVINARTVCEEAKETGDPRGSDADQVGVQHFCPQFAEDFLLLETATVQGTFALLWASYGDDGDECDGLGGMSDINALTPVVVTNGDGDQLVRTVLGEGTSREEVACVFEFEFEVTDGEDEYIVAVGDRGELSMTFEELRDEGVSLSLSGI